MNSRRNAYAILSELYDLRLSMAGTLNGSKPITLERVIEMQKDCVQMQAICAEVAGDLAAMKAAMLDSKLDNETSVESATKAMLESGDLQLDAVVTQPGACTICPDAKVTTIRHGPVVEELEAEDEEPSNVVMDCLVDGCDCVNMKRPTIEQEQSAQVSRTLAATIRRMEGTP